MQTHFYTLFLLFIVSFHAPFVYGQGEKIFSTDTIHEVHLTFSDAGFWAQLVHNYESNQVGGEPGEFQGFSKVPYIMANALIDGERVDSIGVRLKGFTSYGVSTDKKPIKLDFNEFVKGKRFDGLRKLNLNNGEGDPAMQRDLLSYNLMRRAGVPAPRTAYARVYLNDTYWGIYLLVEQVDKTFVKEHFNGSGGNLFKNMGWSELIWEGPDTTQYQRTFELKTRGSAEAWSNFVKLMDVINNSSEADFEEEILQIFDVELFLRVLAVDIATNNWDSYMDHGRNFYLYEEPGTQQFKWIPWDYNLAMGGTFSGDSGGGPIDGDTAITNPFSPEDCNSIKNGSSPYPATDSIFLQVIQRDPFCCDSTWDQACQEMYNAIDSGVDPGPGPGDGFDFQIDPSQSSKVLIQRIFRVPAFQTLYYKIWCDLLEDNFTTERLFTIIWNNGNLIRTAVYDDPNFVWTTQQFEEDLDQGNQIIGLKKFIQSREDTLPQQLAELYACDSQELNLKFQDIVINEFMASNDSLSGLMDDAGDYDDWVELYNKTDRSIDLSNAYLSDDLDNKKKWSFPIGTFIGPKGFLIIWCDEDVEQTGLHSNFKLQKSGESLVLSMGNMVLDSLSFPEQQTNQVAARVPNGTGEFQAHAHTFNANNDFPTGIDKEIDRNTKGISVFPNPAKNRVHLQLNGDLDRIAVVRLYDLNGRLIMQENYASQKVEFSLPQVPSGMYFLQVNNTFWHKLKISK